MIKAQASGFVALLLTFILIPVYRKIAIKNNFIDVPNARSSHKMPIPRGGGLVFFGILMPSFFILFFQQLISLREFMALMGGGFFVGLIGFLDDIQHIPASQRIIVHALAAIWLLSTFDGMPAFNLGFYIWHWGFFGNMIGMLGIIWFINFYNFMDGIDGYAASQGIFVAIAIFLLIALTHHHSVQPGFNYLLWLLIGCLLGFLIWNWAPAKIFMGDVGSSFLGYIFAVLLMMSLKQLTVWPWLILFANFWMDATWTLLRRILRGEKIYIAHRSHGFQHISIKLNSHGLTVSLAMLINIFWLLPMSMLAVYEEQYAILITVIAVLPIFFICLMYKAGKDLVEIN